MGISKYQAVNGRGPKPIQLLVTGIVGGVVLLVISFSFTTYVKGGFKPRFVVNIQAEQVGEGIFEGADVKIDGLRIGQVDKVETHGVDKQVMQISVDPKDSSFLADNVQARFVSSNTLGMTAVELFYTGPRGNQLRDGATITIPRDSQTVTVTSVIRYVGEQFDKIDTGPVGRIGSVLSFEGSSEGIGKMIATAIDLGRMKVGEDILIALDPRPILNQGAEFSVDLERLAGDLLNAFREQSSRIAFFVDRPDDVEAIAVFIARVIGDLINLVPRPGVEPILEGLLYLVGPITSAAGGLASFYDRIPLLVDQIDKSFVANPDGTVSLQVQLLLANMPYLAGDPKVIAAGPQPAPAAPIAGLPALPTIPGLTIPPGLFGQAPAAPAPQGGGR